MYMFFTHEESTKKTWPLDQLTPAQRFPHLRKGVLRPLRMDGPVTFYRVKVIFKNKIHPQNHEEVLPKTRG